MDTYADLPEGKKTALELYISSEEAYELWQVDPDGVLILDVRTPEELLFVGHPPMAWKVPLFSQGYEWNEENQKYPMRLLEDFVARVSTVANPHDKIMVMCRAGGRSAIAVNLLSQAGFSNAYNIVDGMEGDVNGDSDSVANSQRSDGGWKNSGCPWTKKLNPERSVI